MANRGRPVASTINPTLKAFLGRSSDWVPKISSTPTLRHLSGPLLVLISFALSAVPFLSMFGRPGDDGPGLLLGTGSIVAMAWTFVLAIRTRWSEILFGGLDRVYLTHRWLGVIAVLLMWLHIQSSNNINGFAGADPASAELGTTLAGIAESTLYILVIASIVRWLPWRLWRLTHKLLIVPFAFAGYHMITAEKPFPNISVWGLWFIFVIAVGSLAYLVRVIGRDVIWRGTPYEVTDVINHPGAVEITLAPQGRALVWRPGQFAFLKFQVRGASEPHPFSIAANPQGHQLRFMIRTLGDWTDRLKNVAKVGDQVFVEGPYGQLQVLPVQARRTIWIAGGVGITPFLSVLSTLPSFPDQEPPILVHAVREEATAHARSEVTAAAARGDVQVHYFSSSEDKPLTPGALTETLGGQGFRDAHVVVCGPVTMTRWIRRIARRQGAKNIESEIFDLRGGIAPEVSRTVSPWLARNSIFRWLSDNTFWLRTRGKK